MNNISMVESKLPPGFRFHPKDEELVCDYLMKKVSHNNNDDSSLMIDVDLNKCEPWDIPQRACVGGKEWYFYTQRDRKYATGLRTNRATVSGYWKATGKDRAIYLKGALIGMRKTLVFYQGRAPKGKKTEWVMHEFRIEGPHGPPKFSSSKEDWVLCRVFYKSREVVTKPSIGSYYDNTISSSLPQLVDSQTHEYEYEQVPCFSINFNHHITTTTPELLFHNAFFKPITTLSADHTTIDSKLYAHNNTNNAPTYVGPSNLGSCLDTFSCDKQVLTAVLNQLTKMETNPSNQILKGSSNLSGEGSSGSYLSQVGMPQIWNNY